MPARAQTYQFTTLAGNANYLSTDGVGSDARFNGPMGVAVDARGIIYVADSGNSTIRKIAPGGVVTTLAGRPGVSFNEQGVDASGKADGIGRYARFVRPTGMTLDSTGSLLVVDDVTSIRRVTFDGVVTTLPVGLQVVTGLAADRAGNAFVVTSVPEGPAIVKIAPDGTVSLVPGTLGSYTAKGPNGWPTSTGPMTVAVDGSGTVFFDEVTAEQVNFGHLGWHVEYHGSALRRVGADGVVTMMAGSPDAVGSVDGVGTVARFQFITAMTVDAAGNLLVSDPGNACVRKISPGGVVTTLAGLAGNPGLLDGTGSAARFAGPAGVALDASGNLIVADGNRVRSITPGGVVTTLAGSSVNESSYVDAIGSAARFNVPAGLAVDQAGNLVVVESAGHRIRKVSASGVVTTVALTDGSGGTMGSRWLDFLSMTGVVCAPDGGLFVCDSSRIYRVSASGVVTLYAGSAGLGSGLGDSNGASIDARFFAPSGLALDASGNLFIADTGNHLIRKITPEAVVTTFAGRSQQPGSTDGLAGGAQFWAPSAVAVDAQGNVFVADTSNFTIRRITPGGVVTTFAGVARSPGTIDGVGSAARFSQPVDLAFDHDGNLFVADGTTVRRVTPAGLVTTIGGKTATRESVDGTGSAARFGYVSALAVDQRGTLFVADGTFNTIRQGVLLADPARLTNVSVLATLAGGEALTIGTIVGGSGTSGTKSLLARAAGPSLAAFGVSGVLADPRLEFFSGAVKIDENDDWGGTAALGGVFTQVGAFPFTATTSKDAALYLPSLTAGNHTMRVSGAGGAGGWVLTELYDATPPAASTTVTPRLTNVSAIKEVGGGLTAGFIIKGEGTKTVLLRAVGPSLASFGIAAPLADPKLELFDGQSRLIATNDNWNEAGVLAVAELNTTFAQVGAFALAGSSSKDAALLVTLAPGNYTVQVRGVGSAAGVALVEVYEIP